MPPGFMNATARGCRRPRAARRRSAGRASIRAPAFGRCGPSPAVTLPTITLAIGAGKDVVLGHERRHVGGLLHFLGHDPVVHLDRARHEVAAVARSRVASMSVMTRPCEAAPVTYLPSMRQSTAQFVWPVTTMSISSSMASTTGDDVAASGCRRLSIRFGSPPVPGPPAFGPTTPPSCRRTTMASTPCALRKARAR